MNTWMKENTAVPIDRKEDRLFRKKSDVERYLDQLPYLSVRIEKRQETVRRISDHAFSIKSSCSGIGVKVQTSPLEEANFESLILEKEQLEQELAEMQEKYDALKDQAQRIIREQLSGTERSILIWHYINMKTWKTIMEWCDVSERKIYYDKNSALSKIVLPEDAIWI